MHSLVVSLHIMKDRLLNIARIVISLLLLLFLFKRMDLRDIIPLMKGVNTPLLLLSFSGYILLIVFSTMRWWRLLTVQEVRLPFRRVFGYYLIGMFFNNFLPPTIGGGAVRAIYAGRDTGKNKESFASMTCELVLGFVGLFIFVTILLLFYLGRREGRILFLIFLCGSIAFIILFGLFLSPYMVRRLEGLIKRVRIWRIGEKIFGFYSALSIYRNRRTAILVGILLSFGVQTAIGTENFLIAKALGLELGLLPCMVFPSIIGIITILPSIGGLGIREVSYVYFFSLMGIPKEASFSLSLLFYIVGVIGSLPGAVLFALTKRFRSKDIP
jgi:hypothetical protein